MCIPSETANFPENTPPAPVYRDMNYREIDIEKLSPATVDSQSRFIDWGEYLQGDPDWFQCFQAVDCQECGHIVISSLLGEEGHRFIQDEVTFIDDEGEEVTEETECMGTVINEGPMMNYFYPISVEDPHTDDLKEMAYAIKDLPLCVVVMDDEVGLALTGGGMDLSWEICEAYIRLGYLPPYRFTHLPLMADKRLDDRTMKIAQACIRTCSVLAQRARNRVDFLMNLLGELKKNQE